MFCISTIMHLDTTEYSSTARGVYKRIITTNMEPNGPLKSLTKRIHTTKLTPFKDPYNPTGSTQHSCIYSIQSLIDPHKLMTQDEVPELMAYLMSNNYTINTTITDMINSNKKLSNPDKTIICFASFAG